MDKRTQINQTEVREVDESWAIALLEKELGSPVLDINEIDAKEQLEAIFEHVHSESKNTLSAIEKQIQARKTQLANQIQEINKRSTTRFFAPCKLGKKLNTYFKK